MPSVAAVPPVDLRPEPPAAPQGRGGDPFSDLLDSAARGSSEPRSDTQGVRERDGGQKARDPEASPVERKGGGESGGGSDSAAVAMPAAWSDGLDAAGDGTAAGAGEPQAPVIPAAGAETDVEPGLPVTGAPAPAVEAGNNQGVGAAQTQAPGTHGAADAAASPPAGAHGRGAVPVPVPDRAPAPQPAQAGTGFSAAPAAASAFDADADMQFPQQQSGAQSFRAGPQQPAAPEANLPQQPDMAKPAFPPLDAAAPKAPPLQAAEPARPLAATFQAVHANDAKPVPPQGTALAVEIASRMREGMRRFDIRLDPPELGRVDVRLEVDRSGNVTTRLTLDRPETLELMQREARGLERALQQAGLKTDEGGVEFSLRQHADDARAGRHDGTGGYGPDRPRADDGEPAVAVIDLYRAAAQARGGVDIRV